MTMINPIYNQRNPSARVSIERIIDKLDKYLHQKDYCGAERHLQYWVAEAENIGDLRGKLSILNEQIGLYRRMEKKAEGLKAIEEALNLTIVLGIENTTTMGTTLLNAATAYKSFGQTKRAIPLYRQAKKIYDALLQPNDQRLGGLYNNMATALMECKEYDEARALLENAMRIMGKSAEAAITCCNLADLSLLRYGAENAEKMIENYLDQALAILNSNTQERDGYYAFICEKCADAFGYHGYFQIEQELRNRAEECYERN